MIRHGKPALYALLSVVCLMTRAALGQAAVPAPAPGAAAPPAAVGSGQPADVATALAALKAAAPYERADKRASVVAFGDAAVDPLIAEVTQLPSSSDPNYVGQCVIALGELKSPKATSVLLTVLESDRMDLVHWASGAVADIYEGKAAADPQGRLANAMVLANLYAHRPPLALIGPAMALVRMNAMPITRPEGMPTEQLADEIGKWFAQNPAALPPLEQQPWQVLLHTALTSPDAARRQSAFQLLSQKGEFGPVEPICDALAKAGQASGPGNAELGQLLTAMTGVQFPPQGAAATATGEDLVTRWKGAWFEKLRRQTDPKYVLYAWRELENSLRFYDDSPSAETEVPVRYYRSVLIYQVPDPNAIPATTSPTAKDLMTKPLTVKKRIADALAKVETEESPAERYIQLDIIFDEVSQKVTAGKGAGQKIGREVALQFLGRLDRLAKKESSQRAAKLLGNILWQISGIPCDLDRDTLERRLDRLTEWENEARKIGLDLAVLP